MPRLTRNERGALAEFAKPKIDWGRCHGRTLHSLKRKGLVGPKPGTRSGWGLTEAGRAELGAEPPRKPRIPHMFSDSFSTESATIAVDVCIGKTYGDEEIEISIDCQGKIRGDEETIDVVIEMLERAKTNLVARRA